MKDFKLPEHTSLEDDLNNQALLKEYSDLYIEQCGTQTQKDALRIKNALKLTQNKLVFKTDEAADEYGKQEFTKWCTTTPGCKVIKFSKDKNAYWDVAYTLNNVNVIGEIKFRDAYINTYSSWFYEVKKHNNLTEVKKNEDTQIHYINFYQNGTMNIWNTTTIHTQKEPVEREMKASEYSGPQTKLKLVYELKNDETIFTKNNN